MRNVINTIANVTANAIVNRQVRTVMAGVDGVRASSHLLRLYSAAASHLAAHAAPAPQRWTDALGQVPFSGKQKPEGIGSIPGGSDLSRCTRRETSRCRRPRVSALLARS
jgi:hypothetical protein